MIRRLLTGLLASEPVLRRARRRSPPGVTVLMYHEVLGDDDHVEAWTAIRVSELRRQIDYLKSAFDILSMDEALTRQRATRPGVVLTFDDGGAGNHRHLLPVVKEARVPVTVFVSTGHVESGRPYWFDRVMNALQVTKPITLDLEDVGLGVYAVGPPSGADNWAQIQRLLVDIKAAGLPRNDELATIVEQRAKSAGAALRAPLQPMNIQQVRELAASAHVTIGAHSHAHSLLTQMSAADTTSDVAKSRRLLQEWTGQPVEHFAYPSGEYDARVRENVMNCGFRTAVTTEKRLWRSGCDPLACHASGSGGNLPLTTSSSRPPLKEDWSSKFSVGVRVDLSGEKRQQDDSHVEEKRPVIDVVQIVLHTTLHFLERIGVAAIAVDLSPAGNAGLDVMATKKRRNQLCKHLVLRGRVWTRPDERHAAGQDIDQLRKLIDIGMAQEASHAGHSWIVSDDRFEIIALLRHGHRSEFKDANGLVVVAVPCLAKQHRTARIELDSERDDNEKGADQNKADDCGGNIECSLDRPVERREGTLTDPHRHHVSELSDPRHGHEIDGAIRDDVNVNREI